MKQYLLNVGMVAYLVGIAAVLLGSGMAIYQEKFALAVIGVVMAILLVAGLFTMADRVGEGK